MDNEKEKITEGTSRNNIPTNIYSENDSVEVNDMISLAETDVPLDVLVQLEQKAQEELEKLNEQQEQLEESHVESVEQTDIEIQQGIQLADGSISISTEVTEHHQTSGESNENIKHSMDLLEEAKMNAIYKKYVIYIDKENEQYINSLSLKERKQLINHILKTQNDITQKELAEKKRAEMISKLFIGAAIFLISIPMFYFIFNVCLEATIQNYRHSRSNFEVLYKETGKIKINPR